jgi:hypothetical protein
MMDSLSSVSLLPQGVVEQTEHLLGQMDSFRPPLPGTYQGLTSPVVLLHCLWNLLLLMAFATTQWLGLLRQTLFRLIGVTPVQVSQGEALLRGL